MQELELVPQKRPEDLTEAAKSIFQANKAKGFWDKKRTQIELLVLVQSELFEAFEAVRKDRVNPIGMTRLKELITVENSEYPLANINTFKRNFKKNVKDTLQDEIADTIIRLFDFAGAKGMKLYDPREVSELNEEAVIYSHAKQTYSEISFIVANISNAIGSMYENKIGFVEVTDLIFYLVEFAEFNGIDIWLHIELKLFYNSLREHKHGKKF